MRINLSITRLNLLLAQRRLVALLAVVFGTVAACTTTPPTPTPLAGNRAWTPVIQTLNGVEMAQVPAGCFTMGAADTRRDQRPPHQQCVARTFWIDRYEVTNALYGSQGIYAGPQRPRENLTWFEARDFCVSRGGRLPTEAEWEYAARGPSNWIYPWGDTFVGSLLNFDKVSSETAPVGSFVGGESWVGAADLSGNVWEWTSSIYRSYPYRVDDGREDPNDTTSQRVFRGGWLSYQDGGTSALWRFYLIPQERDWRLGFRCARDASN